MDLKRAYEILGVNQNDDFEQIKKKYKELCKKYHPDLYQDKNIKELTEEKLKEVNEAYSLIEEERKKNKESNFNKNTSNSLRVMRWNGYEWTLEEDFIDYNLLRRKLESVMFLKLEYYRVRYENYGTLDNFLAQDIKEVAKIIYDVFEELVSVCIGLNFNTFSSRILTNTYRDKILSNYYDFISECESFSRSVDSDLEYEKARRRLNNAFKQKNILTGAISGAANMVDTFNAKQAKQELYKNPETLETALKLLELAMRECLDIIVDLLGLKIKLNPIITISILDNIKKYNESKQMSKLVEAIMNDPYNKETYIFMLHKYGDSNCELEKLAKYFGISLEQEKLNIVSKYQQEFKESLNMGVEDAKEKFIGQMKWIGRSDSNIQQYFNLHLGNFFKQVFETNKSIDLEKAKESFKKNIERHNLNIDCEEYFSTVEEKERQVIEEKKNQAKLNREFKNQLYISLIIAIISGMIGLTDRMSVGILFFLTMLFLSFFIISPFILTVYSFCTKK